MQIIMPPDTAMQPGNGPWQLTPLALQQYVVGRSRMLLLFGLFWTFALLGQAPVGQAQQSTTSNATAETCDATTYSFRVLSWWVRVMGSPACMRACMHLCRGVVSRCHQELHVLVPRAVLLLCSSITMQKHGEQLAYAMDKPNHCCMDEQAHCIHALLCLPVDWHMI